jgi:hypothetical protein
MIDFSYASEKRVENINTPMASQEVISLAKRQMY